MAAYPYPTSRYHNGPGPTASPSFSSSATSDYASCIGNSPSPSVLTEAVALSRLHLGSPQQRPPFAGNDFQSLSPVQAATNHIHRGLHQTASPEVRRRNNRRVPQEELYSGLPGQSPKPQPIHNASPRRSVASSDAGGPAALSPLASSIVSPRMEYRARYRQDTPRPAPTLAPGTPQSHLHEQTAYTHNLASPNTVQAFPRGFSDMGSPREEQTPRYDLPAIPESNDFDAPNTPRPRYETSYAAASSLPSPRHDDPQTSISVESTKWNSILDSIPRNPRTMTPSPTPSAGHLRSAVRSGRQLAELLEPYVAAKSTSEVRQTFSHMDSTSKAKATEAAKRFVANAPAPTDYDDWTALAYLMWMNEIMLWRCDSNEFFELTLKGLVSKAVLSLFTNMKLEMYPEAIKKAAKTITDQQLSAAHLLSPDGLRHRYLYNKANASHNSDATLVVVRWDKANPNSPWEETTISLQYNGPQGEVVSYTARELEKLLKKRLLVVTHACADGCMAARR